ncbi:hypothetical protein SAMN05444273_101564 [Litoreibacter ascidiaceicola]|uniref:Uncharacterized protein n=1 Tax=Litoreibacter ascidiaceicola TaxID=1486859 RepID=A0A1M4TWB4_9RHOB|nr:hypothetical protein [Litoreibacter ascidiaceicola]SHE48758.1 hypothetical protein SAMN05444273_101564 [Litoreibacter ascidiaceicola]
MAVFDNIIDPRVQQAVVGGLFLAVGWVYNGHRNRLRERRRRLEKMQDVQTALIAEIDHYVVTLKQFDLTATWQRIVGAMEDDDSYTPVVPSERNDTVFSALVAEIHLLPEEVIQPVVGYYNQVFAVDAIIDDLRSDLFREMDQVQRIGMYTDYIALKQEALARGERALRALRVSTGREPNPSSRVAGPSDQS